MVRGRRAGRHHYTHQLIQAFQPALTAQSGRLNQLLTSELAHFKDSFCRLIYSSGNLCLHLVIYPGCILLFAGISSGPLATRSLIAGISPMLQVSGQVILKAR